MNLFLTGDHIRNVGDFYDHHMLVVKVIDKTQLQVIHYTGQKAEGDKPVVETTDDAGSETKSGFIQKCVVAKEIIVVDLSKEIIQLLQYSADKVKYPGEKAVERAKKELGKEQYRVFTNNCESLVNWAITGETFSDQGDTGIAAATVLLGGIILGGIAVYKMHKRQSKK